MHLTIFIKILCSNLSSVFCYICVCKQLTGWKAAGTEPCLGVAGGQGVRCRSGDRAVLSVGGGVTVTSAPQRCAGAVSSDPEET